MPVFLFVLLVAMGLRAAPADTYPSKPIRLVIGLAAGSTGDVRARTVADKVRASIKTPVIIENKPGASGTIAADHVAKALPDGYTLLWALNFELAIAPAVNSNLPYDPQKSFAPVTGINRSYFVLVSNREAGVKTLHELIARAKAKPGELLYGSSGAASVQHVLGEVLSKASRISLTHVPYKGNRESMTALLGGHVHLLFDGTPSALAHIRSRKLVALLAAAPNRFKSLPAVPTAAELGMPELSIPVWMGILAPAATPREIIERLNREFAKARNSPGVQSVFEDSENIAGTPEEFAAFIKSERSRWEKIAKETGVKVE